MKEPLARKPLPLPLQPFFCFRSNFRAITRLETLATQAILVQAIQEDRKKAEIGSIIYEVRHSPQYKMWLERI